MKDDNKTSWINGFKGIIGILLFSYFFLKVFYPAMYNGDIDFSHSKSEIDVALSKSFFNVFFNGHFLQCIFCILTGISLSYKIFSAEKKEILSDVIIKRYIRLVLPVLTLSLIIFFMWREMLFAGHTFAQTTYSSYGFYGELPTFKDIFKTAFISDWFEGDTTFSISFSLLRYIFFGSFLSYILGILSWNKNKKVLIIYIFVAVAYCIADSFYLCFVIGTIIAYVIAKFDNKKFGIIGVICLILGLYLGGYPTDLESVTSYPLDFLIKNITKYRFYHILGAGLIVIGIYYIGPLCKFFSLKIMSLFGNISYSMYLISVPLIMSFSAAIFLRFYKDVNSYCSASLISFILSLVMLIVLSIIFYFLVEFLSDFIAKKFIKFLS